MNDQERKDRLHALDVAIKACEMRINQLTGWVCTYVNCPLCKEFNCYGCPVDENQKGLILSCDQYGELIGDIVILLGKQLDKFIKEHKKLRGKQ